MEESFPALLWILLGDREDLSATYRRADGTPIVTKVRAVTYADLREIARQHPTPKLKTDFATREAKLLVDGFAYFRPGPFMNIDQSQSSSAPSYNNSDYRKFLDDAFRRFIAARTTDLIIIFVTIPVATTASAINGRMVR